MSRAGRWKGLPPDGSRRSVSVWAVGGRRLLAPVAKLTLRHLGGPRMRRGNVGLRQVLQDPVKASSHPLRIIIVVFIIVLVVLVRGVLLKLPPAP